MKLVVLIGLTLLLVGAGCVSTQTNATVDGAMEDKGDSMQKDDSMVKNDSMMDDGTMKKEGEAMTKGVEYVPFTQAAYEQAKADGKVIFLEFYANWCPICKAQDPKLKEGLSQIQSTNLVAFQVNYKDSETDADETALAQKFNITYQHTHVVTNSSEETLLKSQEDWSAQDVVEKVGAFA